MVRWQPGQVRKEGAKPKYCQCRGFGSSTSILQVVVWFAFVSINNNLSRLAVRPKNLTIPMGLNMAVKIGVFLRQTRHYLRVVLPNKPPLHAHYKSGKMTISLKGNVFRQDQLEAKHTEPRQIKCLKNNQRLTGMDLIIMAMVTQN